MKRPMKKTYVNKLPKGIEVETTEVQVKNGELTVRVYFKNSFNPKFGDIVKVILDDVNNNSYKRNYMICIYPNKNFSETNEFFNPPFLSLNGRLVLDDTGGSKYCISIIPASESEKQELFDKLAEVGKRWNPETKQLEDVRWRAKFAEQYFTIRNMYVISYKECNTTEDRELYKLGNYFRTPEAAQKVADQIKELFKNSKTE